LHDVHCRVRGPAARRLLDVFNERWSFHPRREAVDKGMKHLGSSAPHPANMPRHHSRVQIARTYASGTRPRATPLDVTALLNPSAGMNELTSLLLKFDPFAGYPFAPSGKTETWEMVETAIARAKRFIYIENQYLTSIPLAQRLAAALPRLHHLTILITAWSDMDSDAAVSRTRQCLQVLRAADSTGKKLRVFTRTRGTRAYVHAKVFIFDDEFAIVASANGARRSFNCDSEASVGIFDVSHGDEVNLCFARRLRMRLWAEHLKIANEPDLWAIADGVGGVALWDDARGTTQSSRLDIWEYEKFIADYDARAKADPKTTPPRGQPSPQWEWDAIRDPFAPGPR
jgi:phosphatidylserine/phosphatidylglycerophosphate/cardiolipin synthase-like enzyme